MNDHKVIDTSKMRNRRLTFKNLTTKQKNILIGGGLSFAGVMAAVGINRLFAPDELNDVVTDNIHEAIADQSIVNTPDQSEVTNREEPIDVDIPEESAVDEVYSVSIETDARFATSVDDGMSFSEAFAMARNEIGAGGFFNWQDNSYSTFTAEEWHNADPAEQQEFFASVNEQLHFETQAIVAQPSVEAINDTSVEIDRTITQPEPLAPSELDVPSADLASAMNPDVAQPTQDVPTIASDASTETIVVVPPVSYGTGDLNEDGIVDAIAVDNNGDGQADLVAMDEDFDGTFDSFMINEDGDDDLDIFIIDEGGDGIDDSDVIEEIGDVVDMQDFIIVDAEDNSLEGMDFIDDLIEIEHPEEIADDDSAVDDTAGIDDIGL